MIVGYNFLSLLTNLKIDSLKTLIWFGVISEQILVLIFLIVIQSRQGGIATTTTTLKSIELLEKEEKDEKHTGKLLKGIQI